MDTPPTVFQERPTPAVSPVRRFFASLRVVLIAAFVCWHLFFLLFRNPLDLWWHELVDDGLKKLSWWDTPLVTMQQAFPNDPRHVVVTPGKIFSTIDMATWRYGNYFGIEQGWSMFSPPIARRGSFLAAEVILDDGSTEMLLSPNEKPLPDGFYFRWGGWRQRKLEDYLLYETPESIAGKSDPQIAQAYVRWSVRRWREINFYDPRLVARVRLVKRTWEFPHHTDPPNKLTLSESTIGTFLPDGSLAP